MRIIGGLSGFEWDSGNREKNWRRHKVGWWECEEAFFNLPLYVFPDVQHSKVEKRFYALGHSNNNRMLFVVFTVRQSKIRIISARDLNKRERKFYYEKAKKDSTV